MLGMTAGAHRLWAHRSYEANFGLRVFLMLCQTLAGQGNIHDWVVKHRVHHKYFETDDDPYQVHKGFWNAHMFSLTLKKSKRDEQLYKEIDTQVRNINFECFIILLKPLLVIINNIS